MIWNIGRIACKQAVVFGPGARLAKPSVTHTWVAKLPVNKIVYNFQFITIIFLASLFFMLETDEISKINNIIYYLSFICQYYLKLSGYSFLNWSTGRNRFYSLQWWSEQINLPSLHQPLRPKWIHAGTNSCWRNHSGLWQVFITVSDWKWLWVILSKCLEMLRFKHIWWIQ